LLAIDYIKKNYTRSILIDKIAQFVSISRRTLEKKFKIETGTPIHQFLLKYKIELFARAIINSDQSLENIAMDCGFDEYKNVARIFQKYKGTTPQKYRKLHQMNEKY